MEALFLSVNVMMDAKVFSHFAHFDVFTLTGRGRRMAAIAGILVSLAIMNYATDAALLGTVILLIGVFILLSFLIRYRASTVEQINRFRLNDPKPVYRIDFPQEGAALRLAITDQPEQEIAFADLYGVYRTTHAVYLYKEKTQAYIVPLSQLPQGMEQPLWKYLCARVPAAQDKRSLLARRRAA